MMCQGDTTATFFGRAGASFAIFCSFLILFLYGPLSTEEEQKESKVKEGGI